ncbi:hypothetical protein CIB48_g9001 [Xylaria polymorpha]|nr:hypothetical protein CIB48_g9001 [Xylaria polymorpha]
MREYQTMEDERGCTASCFGGISSRLANLLSLRRQPTGAQRIPSPPAIAHRCYGRKGDESRGGPGTFIDSLRTATCRRDILQDRDTATNEERE